MTTICKQCGGQMLKALERGRGVPWAAVALAIIGLGLLFAFPAGTAIGGLLIVAAFVLGYPRKKVWKCAACGFEHA